MACKESITCNTWLNQIKMEQEQKRESEACFTLFEEEYRKFEVLDKLCHISRTWNSVVFTRIIVIRWIM